MDKKMTRREFLEKGAKTVFILTAVTACGDLIALGADKKKKSAEIAVGEDNFIINRADLEQGKAVNFVYRGKKSILLYNDGKITAFENICTHKGGPNKLQAGKLVCQWHGAAFDPLTGEAIKGPAPKGSKLAPIPLKEEAGKIYINRG